jgi:hypothetical protein
MALYESDYTLEDIGEMVLMTRVRKFKKNEEGFAEMLGVSVITLKGIENGKSPHGFFVLKKMQELKMIKVSLTYEL